jgi:hypothetical protein
VLATRVIRMCATGRRTASAEAAAIACVCQMRPLTARLPSARRERAYPGTIVNDRVVLLAFPLEFVAVIVSV